MAPSPLKAFTITVCGGGNGAHLSAAWLGQKQSLKINVLTRRPADWSKTIQVTTKGSAWEDLGEFTGSLNCVTDDPSKVIPSSDLVLVAAPAHAHLPILKNVAPHIAKGTVLGTIFAQGGFDWAAHRAFKGDFSRLDCLFGLQNIPWLCRVEKYGHRVQMIGPKKNLWVAATPPEKTKDIARLNTLLWDIRTETVANFLSLTLTPSNQIIHPGRYYGIFKNWDGTKPLKKEEIQWGLYNEMDDYSASWIQKLDDDLQAIKKKISERCPNVDLSQVLPIGDRIILQYGDNISDKSSLAKIFSTNQGYAGCVTPATPVEGGFTPALQSRLFLEDVPCGLCILKDLAEMVSVPTPSIDFMIEWHQKFMKKDYLKGGKLNREIISETAAPSAYGLKTIEEVVASSVPTTEKCLPKVTA